MIRQGIVNDGILEKKFKILRTSIMLGNVRNREEVMSSYETTAREVDNIRRNVYEELLASKTYTTTSLEDEANRLKDLISFIESRVNERNEFIDDYIKITSNFLDDLPKVSMEDELPSLRMRLDNIDEYLNNCKLTHELNNKLKEKRNLLEEKYESKANNEIINSKLEDELIDEFNKIIADDEYYSGLNYTDIDSELIKINGTINEKKDVMNTFISSFDALKNAGISGMEREEYLSYVVEAKKDYYNELEKMYMLNIYKLVLAKEDDYDRLYQKRLTLDNLIKDRDNNRRDLGVTSVDTLEYFINLCHEQFSVIKTQKFNIEDIDKLILEISDCENKLENIEVANNRPEILALLNEYSEKAPEIEKVDLPDPEEIHDEVFEKEEQIALQRPANMVVKVSEPVKINVKNASDTAKLVMKKVVIVLEPKKFNTKKDKLKEAEKELRREKEAEEIKIDTTENFVETDTDKNEELTDNEGEKKVDIFLDDSTADNDNLNLYNVEVESNDSNVELPDKIFIDNGFDVVEDKKPIDLFNQTDPFLDDNEFEKNENEIREDIIGNMPKIDNIGTVKPNNMLNQIENAANQNKDIILPTMGLANSSNVEVPIVSENYIN